MLIQNCILFYSLMSGIDPTIAAAIAEVESNSNPMAISPDFQDIGLFQIRKKFHKFSIKQLQNPCINAKLATELLAQAKTACTNCLDIEWVSGFNLGLRGFKKLKRPREFIYYKKVLAVINRQTRKVASVQ